MHSYLKICLFAKIFTYSFKNLYLSIPVIIFEHVQIGDKCFASMQVSHLRSNKAMACPLVSIWELLYCKQVHNGIW